jgi:hypothetical protein
MLLKTRAVNERGRVGRLFPGGLVPADFVDSAD